MDIKNFVLKNKGFVVGLVIALTLGCFSGKNGMIKSKYDALVIQNNQLDNEVATLDQQLEKRQKEVNELQKKKNEMDKVAKEKAEKEKLEKEKVAKEEAEKAESDRLAKEQANNTDGDTSSSNVQSEDETGEMVWLSETGKKYHSINNCGRMKASRARQISLKSAREKGIAPCSKCN